MKKLSIIIPFGTSDERSFINERVAEKSRQFKDNPDIEVIFAEGYSSQPAQDLRHEILADGHLYVKDHNQTRFSLARCRNLGATHASCPMCLFLDVDLHLSAATLEKLISLAYQKEVPINPNRFIVVPCAFLTAYGSAELAKLPREQWDMRILYEVNSGNSRFIDFLDQSSSCIVVNRHKFMELGGFDKNLIGHGGEDFDFLMRLIRTCAEFEHWPRDLKFESPVKFHEYRGFRALFAVAGFESLTYGLLVAHIYHPVPNNAGYLDNQKKNRSRFFSRIDSITSIVDGPDPLVDKSAIGKRIMLLDKEGSATHKFIRGARPYLGEMICKDYVDFFEGEEFQIRKFDDYLEKSNINVVAFYNGHGTTKKYKVYSYLKESQIPFICMERGALPDSWFFDSTGFNADSRAYTPDRWNHELTDGEVASAEAYIHNLKTSDHYLETQGEKQAPGELRKKLGISYKKVVFIPLQLKNDTVIKYYTRKPFDYGSFIRIADEIAGELVKEDWVFVSKKHPLDKDFPKNEYRNIIFAEDDTNISSLLEISDVVLTINSGVGLYAMMYEKPCLIAGEAFYAIEGVNVKTRSKDEIKDFLLRGDFSVDRRKMLKFIHYLVNEFYSFGAPSFAPQPNPNKTFRYMEYIDFWQIVINGKKALSGTGIEKYKYKKSNLGMKPFISEIETGSTKLAKVNPKINQRVKAPEPSLEKTLKEKRAIVERKRVLLVTDSKFWRPVSGALSRVGSICAGLNEHFDVVVYYLGNLDKIDNQLFQTCYPPSKLFSAGAYEKNCGSIAFDDSIFETPGFLKERRDPDAARALRYFLNACSQYDAILFDSEKTAWLSCAIIYNCLRVLAASPTRALQTGESGASERISLQNEVEICNSFDLVLLMNRQEYDMAISLFSDTTPLYAPHHTGVMEVSQPADGVHFGYVASGTDTNLAAITWFIENIWPLRARNSSLHIFGSICERIGTLRDGVKTSGFIENRMAIYRQCNVMLNPSTYECGLQIKSVEALAYGRPLLTFPPGASGIGKIGKNGVLIANSRKEFGDNFLRISYDSALRKALSEQATLASLNLFSREICFGELVRAIRSY